MPKNASGWRSVGIAGLPIAMVAGIASAGSPAAKAIYKRSGARLEVFSTVDGSSLKSYTLPSPPAFDGMIAPKGRLYITGDEGSLFCMAEE